MILQATLIALIPVGISVLITLLVLWRIRREDQKRFDHWGRRK
ncbi:hypothetical protein [Roseibium album]